VKVVPTLLVSLLLRCSDAGPIALAAKPGGGPTPAAWQPICVRKWWGGYLIPSVWVEEPWRFVWNRGCK